MSDAREARRIERDALRNWATIRIEKIRERLPDLNRDQRDH